MADHLDFIRIQGLEVSDAEVFQGVSGKESANDTATSLEWGEIPEEAVTLLSDYTDDVNAWLTDMQSYEPDEEGTRALTNLPAIPVIPALFTALATGGASLPAVATIFISQAIINLVGSAIQDYASRFDTNSLEYILRKAMLYKDAENVEQSVLNDRLSDLAYVDQIIDFGAFRVHIKGKMIEYN